MPNLDVLLWSTDVTSDLSIPLYHKYNIQWSIWYKFNGFLPQYVENEDREIMQGGIQEWHNLNTSLVCSPIHNLT